MFENILYFSYFSHVHLQRRVHFNLVFTHLQRVQVFWQLHLIFKLKKSLARGIDVQTGSSLLFSSFQPCSVGLLTGMIVMCADVHMLAWNTLLFRCRAKASLVGGILSTSLVFSENNRSLTRSISSPTSFV